MEPRLVLLVCGVGLGKEMYIYNVEILVVLESFSPSLFFPPFFFFLPCVKLEFFKDLLSDTVFRVV